MKGYDPYQAQHLFPDDQWELVAEATDHSDTTLQWNFGVEGMVGLRDASQQDGPVLVFDTGEWTAVEEAIKRGETRLASQVLPSSGVNPPSAHRPGEGTPAGT